MNKSTVTAAVTLAVYAVSPTAITDEINGVYLQGDIGLSSLKAITTTKDRHIVESLEGSYRETGIMPRISGGYDFGDWRLAADYTHYARLSSGKAKVRAHSVGISTIYDVDTGSTIQPYIGARLSVNKIKSEFSNNEISHNKTQVSPGVIAGVGLKISKNTTIDAEYRYNHLDETLRSNELTVGVRYTFL